MNSSALISQNIIQLHTYSDLEIRKEFQTLLAKKQLRTVFQPIIDLTNGSTLGFEGLTRGPIQSRFQSPIQLFKYAEELGSLYTLEKIARELAFENSSNILKNNEKLFINLSPQVIYDPSFTPGHTISLLKQYKLSPQNIVFEITERSAIEDFSAFTKVLYHYRDQGFQIAVDDAGAGYSSLQAISEIQPDYIKVDRSLISKIHENKVKKHILDAFVTFAKKMDSIIIAEGIEMEEELEAVMQLGIDCGQGFYISRPSFPVSEIDETLVEKIRCIHSKLNKKRTQEPVIVQLDDEILIMNKNQIIKKVAVRKLLQTSNENKKILLP
ncbi:PAS domain S-box/diguanylate cyclase (GGDEF) domain-containing protein [Mycobacteroides abscessus subsp. abscessus]|nr:PAS domain S-box/diguanylate cyclase (GGDEF) domain-containing protein [Mycobacteroides abscessus subsp. abscessus]